MAAKLCDIGSVDGLTGADVEASAADRGELAREHPERGASLLSALPFTPVVVAAVRHHHERWDGRGYPTGLSGEDIPRLARVIAVADSYLSKVRGSDHSLPRPLLSTHG